MTGTIKCHLNEPCPLAGLIRMVEAFPTASTVQPYGEVRYEENEVDRRLVPKKYLSWGRSCSRRPSRSKDLLGKPSLG